MACITEGSTGFPGSNGAIPFENGFLSETYDRWPLGRGFERYYGFLGGDTHQYYPDLVFDNHQVDPPRLRRRATTCRRISPTGRSTSSPTSSRWRRTSPSSCTSPPVPTTRRTRLPPNGSRNTAVRSSTAGTRVARRCSRVRADDLAQNLEAIDQLGGPKHFNHYSWGWTFAGNTPFRRWKRETYRGGVADAFMVHWPAGIAAKGELRHQYGHVIDMVLTVLEALGIDAPTAVRGITQSPIEGVSLAHTFADAEAPTEHRTQYFEMFAHQPIYHDGWRAVCPFPGTSFEEAGVAFGMLELGEDRLRELDATGWELYHVDVDPTETNDLAATERPKLIEMIALWYAEAGNYNVLPLDSRGTMRFADERPEITVTTGSAEHHDEDEAKKAEARVAMARQ